MAPFGPVASTVIDAGTVTTGGVVSRTVTSKEPLAELFDESVAVQVTVVEPIGNVAPLGWSHDGAMLPSTRSFADAE